MGVISQPRRMGSGWRQLSCRRTCLPRFIVRTHKHSKPALIATFVTLSVFVAGCAANSATTVSSSTATASSAATALSASAAGPLTAPRRIVSLSPSATEDLFAIGADSQVVSVDSNSNYPSSVPKSDLSAYQPNAESIAKP